MYFDIKPLNFWERFADLLMIPVMKIVSCRIFDENGRISLSLWPLLEMPQQTHFWNNQKLTSIEIENLDENKMVQVSSYNYDRFFKCRNSGIKFHCPIFGGWYKYVTILPINIEDTLGGWHIGWKNSEICGVSRIKNITRVRVLLGHKPVQFFGISESGMQIPIRIHSFGHIGDRSKYARKFPLL